MAYKKTDPLSVSRLCASPLPLVSQSLRGQHPAMSEASSIDKEKTELVHPEKTVAGSTVDVAAHAIAGKEIDFTPEESARVR